MNACAYCASELTPGPPWAPQKGHRLAFDPHRGRLWSVCPACRRWNITPLEDRWETLQACQKAVKDQGRELLRTRNLTLFSVGPGELIRVENPPRPEFVDWRYGLRLALPSESGGFLARLLARLPPPPPEGYDPYKRIFTHYREEPWFASPFLEAASPLTYLFSQIPLAPECPSCRRPLAVKPWEFQDVRLRASKGAEALQASCGLCLEDVEIPLRPARPVLRLALGLVTPSPVLQQEASRAATILEESGGSQGFLHLLSVQGAALGELQSDLRAGLIISLDEWAEAEALEAEWREAEEVAEIHDGELTEVQGFSDFRRRILESDA